MLNRTLVLLLAAAVSPAADVRGPVLGYVLDARARAVRPLNGFPGASHLGSPVGLPFPVSNAAFATRADFALVAAESGEVYLLRDAGAPEPLAGVLSRPDRIVFSGTESAAVLYSSQTRQAQILRGLPDAPAAGPLIDLASLPGQVTALALAAGPPHLLVAARDQNDGALYLIRADGERRVLATSLAPSALALVNRDRDVVVADAAAHRLLLIRDYATSADLFHWAGPSDGVSDPVGLAASPAGDRLFVANAGSLTLDIFDLATRALAARLPLDSPPTRLSPLRHSVLLMNDLGSSPLLLLDTVGSPGVYFVPAIQGE